MKIEEIAREFERLTELIGCGEFQSSHEGAKRLLQRVSTELAGDENYHVMLFNTAGLLIDIGGMQPNSEATMTGLKLLKDHEREISQAVGKGAAPDADRPVERRCRDLAPEVPR